MVSFYILRYYYDMSTVNIIRKQASKFSNTLTFNENVHMILENRNTKWSRLSRQIKQVADMVEDNDFGPSTILGQNAGFMEPFRQALENYKTNYSQSSWCHQHSQESDIKEINYPFRTKPWDMDVSFATKTTIPDGGKVIVIGDIHSSIHSIKEILDSFLQRGIMSENFEISDEYTIIFLGDILDRGPFGLDIIHIIFRLKNSNPFQKVIILNGNHEDVGMYTRYGFGDEISTQLKDINDIKLIKNLLTYLPSVLFLDVNETILQLNHGGIETSYSPIKFIASIFDYQFHGVDDGNKLFYKGLRWSDFDGTIEGEQPSSRGGKLKKYGKDYTDEYLAENGLSGFIRGHQDFHHFAILPRDYTLVFRDLDIIEEEDIGMYYPKENHWKRKLGNDWDKISIIDAFDDFSVVTTSTAVRARDLGYHTYIEITNSYQDIRDELRFMQEHRDVSREVNAFIESLGLGKEFRQVLRGEKVSGIDERKKWKDLMKKLSKHEGAEAFFPVLLIDGFLHKIY